MGRKGKKKPQSQEEQSAAPTQEKQPGPSSQPSADQSKKGQLPAPPGQGPQEGSGPQGDQPRKGKKGGQQPGPASQGTQSEPQAGSTPHGDQPKKGPKGPPQQLQSQQSRQDPQQSAKAAQQGQGRQEGSQQPQRQQQPHAQQQGQHAHQQGSHTQQQGQQQRQQGPQGQRQRQQGPQGQQGQHAQQQGQQQGPQGQRQRQQHPQDQRHQGAQSQQQPQAWAQQQQPPQQRGGQPLQQRGQAWGTTQQVAAPPSQSPWGKPQQAPLPGLPIGQSQTQQQPVLPQQPMIRTQGPPGGPPGHQQIHGAPVISPQGLQGPPQRFQGPPQGYQGPPQGYQGPPQGYQGPPQGYQGPPQGYQGPPQGYQGPPQGYQGPPQGYQGPPQEYQGPPQGYQGPPQGIQAPTQQPAKAPPQSQKKTGKGPQTPRTSGAPVADVSASLVRLEIAKKDAGDAGIVSPTMRKPGTKGKIIKVESNHLQLNLGSLKTAYHYDVNIDPDKPKKFMRPVVASFIRKHFPKRSPAFDGKKNLYTSSPLVENLNEIIADQVSIREEDGREKQFKVEIKFANKVNLTGLNDLLKSPVTPQEALQVVDIVLRMAPVEHCFPVGRSFFVKPDQIIDLGQGMEMYHGFYQSAIRGWKPLLNVDVAHKAFPKNINVVDALVDLLSTARQEFRRENLRSLDRFQEDTLNSFIKTLRVTYVIPNHPESRKDYRVNGIGVCAQNAKFTHENRELTVVEYFNRFKNYKIRYPELPTLWVGNSQRTDKILLPLELCCICEGQALNRKMTEMQTSKMIKHAATNTAVRKSKIMQGVQRSNYNQNPCLKEFGFSVGNEFQKLDARVLVPPILQYKDKTATVFKGVWRNETFLTGVTINNWTVVNACKWAPRPDDYKNMISLFERSGRDCGMVFASKVTEPFKNIPGRQSYSDIEQYFKSEKGKFDVIFVIVPDSGPQYSYVKKAAEIAVGCLTQCIKSNTVSRKMNQQTAVNILLKVNSKLNGINHTFSRDTKPNILRRPCMIMGADVTHPGPDSKDIPSVAAVTASHEPKAFQYNICWRLQGPRVEIIEDLEAMVQEHLAFFQKKNAVKPETIVFFRDGVSEGQFEQVRNAEIRAIRSACKKMQQEDYEPKITFLVVQKRHHTRLFPLNPRDSEDRNMNVPAGTCVDTTITHPYLQDFYLVSHASIQGVAKPTKYCTLWDDNNLDNDQVEELAYYLCHMFSRCNRSVSYPAPTYYAHLAAARAKVYIENDRLNMDRLKQEFQKFQIRDEIRKDKPMFFV